MEKLYKKIAETFNLPEAKQLFIDAGLIPIKMIDINVGQSEDPEGFEVPYPSIFMSWGESRSVINEPLLMNLQFHVLQYPGKQTHNKAADIDKGLNYVKTLAKIQQVLNGIRSEETTPLRYFGKTPNINPYGRYHILNYQCHIDEVHEHLTRQQTTDIELTGYEGNFEIKQKKSPEDNSEAQGLFIP